ncbi:GDYXXLXY domain-containing protein [Carboxylicivirga sp. RSCT41]|uniref:GDYXXLXY domain-containing protein n=1 Tax=Carboxylicivirga agarovorans TaxID=3417570 RepID=UPI003D3393F9
MNNKKILLSAFILIALIQLFVPVKMIWDREKVIDSGTVFRFMTAPVDPNDPFRGKYITLNYRENTFRVEDTNDWTRGEYIYVYFSESEDGFAQIQSVSKTPFTDESDFILTKVQYVSKDSSNTIVVEFPFDRFYMEESKAYDAEHVYRQSQIDTTSLTYALVSIKDGEAVLQDVLIDEIPIKELVEKDN